VFVHLCVLKIEVKFFRFEVLTVVSMKFSEVSLLRCLAVSIGNQLLMHKMSYTRDFSCHLNLGYQ